MPRALAQLKSQPVHVVLGGAHATVLLGERTYLNVQFLGVGTTGAVTQIQNILIPYSKGKNQIKCAE